MSKKISVTIPVYNEEVTLTELYKRLISVLDRIAYDFEIVFINDGSSDNSGIIMNELADADPRVHALHFTRNFGQTAAMMAGFDFATGDIIVPMDADLQNDPEDIPRLVAKLEEGYHVCSGWRKNRKDSYFKRNLASFFANKLISKISGVKLKDYGCTMKAYHRDVIKGVRLYGEMHRFIPIYASWEGAKIAEITVKHHPRKHGKSSYGFERTIKVLLDLIVVTFLDNYAQKPIYVFGGFGFFCFLISILSIIYATYLKIFSGISYIQTPLPLIFIMGFIIAIMSVLLGLLAEMIMRTYYESQGKRVYLLSETRNSRNKS